VGLYASVAPLLLYAVFGTSRALAVGPVAVVSLMTAAAIGQHAAAGTPAYWAAAHHAGLPVGRRCCWPWALLRLGFLANFLSHPVISGFITRRPADHRQPAQDADGRARPTATTLVDLLLALGRSAAHPCADAGHRRPATAFLFWVRKGLKPCCCAWAWQAPLPTCWPRPDRWRPLPSPPGWWALGWQARA
jgi:SulP family sulfate permease